MDIFFNTLDIDGPLGADKDFMQRVIQKIKQCPHLLLIEWKLSSSLNGAHVSLWCLRDCDICRLVYDDQVRFSKDQNRPGFSRDVLFDRKVVFKRKA